MKFDTHLIANGLKNERYIITVYFPSQIKPTAVLIGNCTSGKYQEHVCTEFTRVISEMAAGEGHGISYIFYDKHAAADPKCSILRYVLYSNMGR